MDAVHRAETGYRSLKRTHIAVRYVHEETGCRSVKRTHIAVRYVHEETGCRSVKRTHIAVRYVYDRVEIDRRLSGQYVVLLMDEDFLP